jgi:leader peptidase (prepilin peptidase)/N-methyltransferase
VLSELEPVAATPGAYAFAVLLGLLWGSFANVCIYRWAPSEEFPNGRSVVKPGSHCSACKTPIKWYDNVPLLSYLWLRGKCRACKATFSPRYLAVEAITGALFGVAWWFCMGPAGMLEPFEVRLVRFVIAAGFVFVMVVITFIDLDTMLILDKVTIPSTVIFYLASLLLPERRWYDGLIGIAIGYGVPWLIGALYYRIRKREGLGLGDAKLLALVGALFGWKGVFVSLFGGSVLGTILTVVAMLSAERGEDGEPAMTRELAFGPYLAAAAVFYLFAEPWIEVHFRLTGM